MKKLLLILIYFLLCIPFVRASHIVGGEFQIAFTGRGNNYQLMMKMYFDETNNGGELREPDIMATIYRKRDNQWIRNITLRKTFDARVSYAFEGCLTDVGKILQYSLLKYTSDLVLDPQIYNDPEGYYVVWERCCRNSEIDNIHSPGETGQAFYMEFGPTFLPSGVRYLGSPVFPDIKGDYYCTNTDYNLDFGAVDASKNFADSLVFSLITPFKGYTSDGNPVNIPPLPAPYPTVNWKPGYSGPYPLGAESYFSVNRYTGILSFNGKNPGLYLFGVICEQYKDGKKIGEVRRDFQFKFVKCSDNYEPVFELRKDNIKIPESDTIYVNIKENNCLYSLAISDSTYNWEGKQERISISTLSSAFSSNLPAGVLTFTTGGTLQSGTDTLKSTLCFSACDKLLIEKDSVYYVRLKSQDFRCPVMEDTIDLIIKVIVPENNKPKVTTNPVSPFTYYANDTISIDIIGMDADTDDIITLSANGEGFDLGEKGMSFKTVSGKDSIVSKLEWIPDCEAIENQPYKIVFKVKDNSCIQSHEDTTSIVINLQDKETTLPAIAPPNLITPNADGLNDVFEIPTLKGDLFPDNCEYFYKSMQIYNIWGAKVFESESRDFKWDPKGFPDGIYFYYLDLNKKEITGWLQIVRGLPAHTQ